MPCHGKLNCSVCWNQPDDTIQDVGPFRFVRDPGHWGSDNPHTLVLGISKGETQSKAIANEDFDTVGFKKFRPRMLQVFNSVGVFVGENSQEFDCHLTSVERDYAFASVVRCSITGMDKKTGKHNAASPNVTPAFKKESDAYRLVSNCITTFLKSPAPRVRLVILLGNDDSYMKAISRVIADVRGPVSKVNPVAFDSDGIRFVHITHPSGGNGHFGAYINGKNKAGMKRDWAREALLPFASS